MKVIHVLKKIEQIDDDVRELRKMEKSLQRNKSFTTPIFMTIEKQINNLLGDKNKILELNIANPPEAFAREFDGDPADTVKPLRKSAKSDKGGKKAAPKQKEAPVKAKTKNAQSEPMKEKSSDEGFDDMDSIPMLTQDMIDSRFDTMKSAAVKDKPAAKEPAKPILSRDDDRDVKLLDIALTKGTLNKEEIEKEKDKKRVRFFRDNFPGSDY